MKLWLVDTGPLVAYLDASDPFHARVGDAVDSFTGAMVSTPAVVTEAMYFLGSVTGGPGAFAALVSRSGMAIYDVCQPSDLPGAARLMARYGDTPMDFADATLVQLAELLEVYDVLTLDRRGFSTYRTGSGRGFRLVLDS